MNIFPFCLKYKKHYLKKIYSTDIHNRLKWLKFFNQIINKYMPAIHKKEVIRMLIFYSVYDILLRKIK